jgi:hypothetical protein
MTDARKHRQTIMESTALLLFTRQPLRERSRYKSDARLAASPSALASRNRCGPMPLADFHRRDHCQRVCQSITNRAPRRRGASQAMKSAGNGWVQRIASGFGMAIRMRSNRIDNTAPSGRRAEDEATDAALRAIRETGSCMRCT